MGAMAYQITSPTLVYSTVYLGADKKNQSSAPLAFVRSIYRWPVNSPHKGPATRNMFPFDVVIMRPEYSKKIKSIYRSWILNGDSFLTEGRNPNFKNVLGSRELILEQNTSFRFENMNRLWNGS